MQKSDLVGYMSDKPEFNLGSSMHKELAIRLFFFLLVYSCC